MTEERAEMESECTEKLTESRRLDEESQRRTCFDESDQRERTDTFTTQLIPPFKIAYVWSLYVPYIQKFLDKSEGESSMETILKNIMDFNYQCWEIRCGTEKSMISKKGSIARRVEDANRTEKSLISKKGSNEVANRTELMGVCITKIDTYAEYKALHILGIGSEVDTWDSFKTCHLELEKFAKAHNCDRITCWGRKSWMKVFEKSNFKGSNGEKYTNVYNILHMKLT